MKLPFFESSERSERGKKEGGSKQFEAPEFLFDILMGFIEGL